MVFKSGKPLLLEKISKKKLSIILPKFVPTLITYLININLVEVLLSNIYRNKVHRN